MYRLLHLLFIVPAGHVDWKVQSLVLLLRGASPGWGIDKSAELIVPVFLVTRFTEARLCRFHNHRLFVYRLCVLSKRTLEMLNRCKGSDLPLMGDTEVESLSNGAMKRWL